MKKNREMEEISAIYRHIARTITVVIGPLKTRLSSLAFTPACYGRRLRPCHLVFLLREVEFNTAARGFVLFVLALFTLCTATTRLFYVALRYGINILDS